MSEWKAFGQRVFGIFLLSFFCTPKTWAGVFEVAYSFGFNRTTYSEESFAWNRRQSVAFGYHFTDVSGIEFAFQDITSRTLILGFQDTTLHDQIYSVNWVQALAGRNAVFQPYLKLGFGQLNRNASGNYLGVVAVPTQVDSITVVMSAGIRIAVFRNTGLKLEATSYLEGGSIRTWKDNVAGALGLSIYF